MTKAGGVVMTCANERALGEPELSLEQGGQLAADFLTAQGYAAVPETGETPVRGVFVAGDCRGKRVRQLATAGSDGANAALAACRYLDGEE